MCAPSRILPLEDPRGGSWLPPRGKTVEATFRRRVNRFVAEVELDGSPTLVHVPTSGRLTQLARVGNRVILREASSPRRKTHHDWIMAESPGGWALVDSRVGGSVLGRALEEGSFSEFAGARTVRREVTLGDSRLDFLLEHSGARDCWLEVKSVTLAAEVPWGFEGRFPDAPTERGRRHLRELMRARHMGHRAAVLFAVGRPEANSVAPNPDVDPDFTTTLWKAAGLGVEVYAYRIDCSPEFGYRLGSRLQINLGDFAR